MNQTRETLTGAGIGLRRSMMRELLGDGIPEAISFFELAPENWIGVGGRLGRQLRQVAEQRPLVCHGLSLSIGGPAPLDTDLVSSIGEFLNTYQVPIYSEHLSYTSDGGQLYDLLPMPFTEEAVMHTAARVRQVQDIIGRRMALENVSYYLTPRDDMGEIEFLLAVLEEADCDLLLDVNNVYVNSVNHGYDPLDYIRRMPTSRISYLHIAGHYNEPDGLIVDTHGADVIDPVWQLLSDTYATIGSKPTLLERDFNIPPVSELLVEVEQIRGRQAEYV